MGDHRHSINEVSALIILDRCQDNMGCANSAEKETGSGRIDETYGIVLGEEKTHEHSLTLQVDAGEDFLVSWTKPSNRWTNISYDKFELTFNGKQGTEIQEGGTSGYIKSGDVVGSAIHVEGPGEVRIEMAYRVRPKLVEARQAGNTYEAPEPFKETDATDSNYTFPAPVRPLTSAQLEDPAFLKWLNDAELESIKPGEHPIEYHKRLAAHIANTISFEFTTESVAALQNGPGAIVQYGKGDCGSMALLEVAAMQRQGIKARNNVAEVHIFAEFYFDGIGWVNPTAEAGNGGTGASGHTIHIGGALPVLDLSGMKHGPAVFAGGFYCAQQPSVWKDGK